MDAPPTSPDSQPAPPIRHTHRPSLASAALVTISRPHSPFLNTKELTRQPVISTLARPYQGVQCAQTGRLNDPGPISGNGAVRFLPVAGSGDARVPSSFAEEDLSAVWGLGG
jgi:hypothetical protein